jgi:DNA-binding response OmpR family regulator
MATQEPFDLIVTDIYMPDGDGLEVIRELRRVRPNIHFIAMSGMTGQRDMLKVAKYLGACQTLQKPFSADDLLAAVEATIGRSPPQAEEETSKQLKQGEDSC